MEIQYEYDTGILLAAIIRVSVLYVKPFYDERYTFVIPSNT